MNFKGLMLAAAAATAATGASAADLPVAPEPVDYVKVCDTYGATFYYIPGTDTCLRVGGRVRAEYKTNNFADKNSTWSGRETNATFSAKGLLYLDSRTATEFGLLRTYTEYEITNADSASLGKAFIQWGGFTFGHAASFFDFPVGQVYVGGSAGDTWSDTTTNLIAYTAAFGNGFSATVSLEDSSVRNYGSNVAAAMKFPDLVANLRVDQGWGSAQISGALHNNRQSKDYFSGKAAVGTTPAIPANGAKGALGWAIDGGVAINLPMIGANSKVAFNAAYADGALSYIGVNTKASATASDLSNIGSKTSKGWAVGGGIFHRVGAIDLGIDGGYSSIDWANVATDTNYYGVQGSVKWSPVSNFDIGVGVGYSNEKNKGAGVDTDTLSATLRVQRTF